MVAIKEVVRMYPWWLMSYIILSFCALSLETDGIVNLALRLALIIRVAVLSYLFNGKLLKLAGISPLLCITFEGSLL